MTVTPARCAAARASRPSIVTIDGNSFWMRQFFAALATRRPVQTVCPIDIFSLRKQRPEILEHQSLAQHHPLHLLRLPPSWMGRFWPVCQHWVRHRLKGLGAGSDGSAVIITRPEYYAAVPSGTSTVYFNFDDYALNDWARKFSIREQERQVVSKAKATICTSKYRSNSLKENYPEHASKIWYLPLGCTPQYMPPAASPSHFAYKLRALASGRPTIGYVGSLNERFDFQFFSEVCRLRPQYLFVLAGQVPQEDELSASEWRALETVVALSNVLLAGYLPHREIGSFMQAFDTLIMCHSKCEFNDQSSPTKLWDYLGSGKPIVANEANPETLLYPDIAATGATPEFFVRQLDQAVDSAEAQYLERLALARNHTWKARAVVLEEILCSVL